jgi:5-methylthioadenosine/S-adenosylhomocysteine deaminase
MLRKGINVSLGTDGKSSNDSQDIYEVLKSVALLHKVHQPEFDRWLGAPEAWQMGTIGGATSVGMPGQVGTIARGQRADLVLFDLASIPFTPLNNPLHQLVYCLPSSSVDSVIVEGQLVVRGGSLTRVDERELLLEGNELGRSYLSRTQPAFELSHQIFPSVAAGYRKAVSHDVGVHRYIGESAS